MITALLSVVVAMLPPCASDDGSTHTGAPVCVWVASNHGNGDGASFIMANDTVIVIP